MRSHSNLSLEFGLYPELWDSVSSKAGLFGKLIHGATSPLGGGEPSYAPKILKITHQRIRPTTIQGLS